MEHRPSMFRSLGALVVGLALPVGLSLLAWYWIIRLVRGLF